MLRDYFSSQQQELIVGLLVTIIHMVIGYWLVVSTSIITINQTPKDIITPITLVVEKTHIATHKTNAANDFSTEIDIEINSLAELNAIYTNDYDDQTSNTLHKYQITKQLDDIYVADNKKTITDKAITDNVVHKSSNDKSSVVNEFPIHTPYVLEKSPRELVSKGIHTIDYPPSVEYLHVPTTSKIQPINTTTELLPPSDQSIAPELSVHIKNEKPLFFTEYAKNNNTYSITANQFDINEQSSINIAMALNNEQVRKHLLNPLPTGLTDQSKLSLKSEILKDLLVSTNSNAQKRVVKIAFLIDSSGQVILNPAPSIEKSSGNIYIDNDAMIKVSEAVFQPFTISGKQVNVHAEIQLVY